MYSPEIHIESCLELGVIRTHLNGYMENWEAPASLAYPLGTLCVCSIGDL